MVAVVVENQRISFALEEEPLVQGIATFHKVANLAQPDSRVPMGMTVGRRRRVQRKKHLA